MTPDTLTYCTKQTPPLIRSFVPVLPTITFYASHTHSGTHSHIHGHTLSLSDLAAGVRIRSTGREAVRDIRAAHCGGVCVRIVCRLNVLSCVNCVGMKSYYAENTFF